MSPISAGQIDLVAVPNFRDIGGIEARDGQITRRGLIYRSAAFGAATTQDRQRLDALGIRWVCDLRASGERGSRAKGWPQEGLPDAAEVWFDEAAHSVGNLLETVVGPNATPDQVRAEMQATYRALPYSHNRAFAEILARAARGDRMVIHCSAGKDRTGVAVAILLDLLGVPRDAIMADYLKTQAAFDALSAFILDGPKGDLLRAAGQRVWGPMMAAEESYLQAAFDAIDARHGDARRYAREVLGFVNIDRLKSSLLQAGLRILRPDGRSGRLVAS